MGHQSQASIFPQPLKLTNAAVPIQTSFAGGAASSYDILNPTTSDELYQQLVPSGGQPLWKINEKPAGGVAEVPFQMLRRTATATEFDLGKSADTLVDIFSLAGDLRLRSNGAGNVVWLCGGTGNCLTFVDGNGVFRSNQMGQRIANQWTTTLTLSAGAATFTFGTAFGNIPVCTLGPSVTGNTYKVVPSTTNAVVTSSLGTDTSAVGIICVGNPN
jgi:hypothetical protein